MLHSFYACWTYPFISWPIFWDDQEETSQDESLFDFTAFRSHLWVNRNRNEYIACDKESGYRVPCYLSSLHNSKSNFQLLSIITLRSCVITLELWNYMSLLIHPWKQWKKKKKTGISIDLQEMPEVISPSHWETKYLYEQIIMLCEPQILHALNLNQMTCKSQILRLKSPRVHQ